MKTVKNANDKTVCQIYEATKTVEIVHKGFKTIIRFAENGKVIIVNEKPTA